MLLILCALLIVLAASAVFLRRRMQKYLIGKTGYVNNSLLEVSFWKATADNRSKRKILIVHIVLWVLALIVLGFIVFSKALYI